ncbi:MAG: cell division protein [Gammaproteobacteria bacterium]|nr:cell division protein [Gammaproteobacteria bacterium]
MSRRNRVQLHTWLARHLQVALSSLGRYVRAPLSSLMTTAVIGIAIALPTGLHLLLENIQELGGSWDGTATISLFLHQEASHEAAAGLARQLNLKPGITHVSLIDKNQALQEFQRLSGFADALEALGENPLPEVIVVEPASDRNTPEAARTLLTELQNMPLVALAQLDLQWVQRFHAITDIARRTVAVLASLLSLAVLLIVVNTIRLEIQNRHSEIEIIKLIGGTNAFIRRPFLYAGIWYGLFGGVLAWVLVTLAIGLLDSPVDKLAGLYNSAFVLSGPDFHTVVALIGGSTLLGLAGSWVAVGRHLHEIEPQ